MTAIMAIAAIMMSASCGNANAKNEDTKKDKKEVKTAVKAMAVTTEEFNAKVYDMTKEGLKYLGNKPAIVDFTATWCGPCQRIAPILDELAAEYDGKVFVYKVDID